MGSCKSQQLVTSVTLFKTPQGSALFRSRAIHSTQTKEQASVHTSEVKLRGASYFVSCCMIPGSSSSSSKDTWLCKSNGETLLLGVFDGHGSQAGQVVEHCRSFAVDFYGAERPITQPYDFLVKLNKAAEASLTEESSIDSTYSGTSQTLLLLINQTVFVSNVGDSKCCLASRYGDPNEQDYTEEPMSKLVRTISRRRSLPTTGIVPTILTVRHVPTNDDECTRILRHHARVQQLARDGKRFGPYRVWEPRVDMPGLTITRTLGDSSVKDLGVTAIPSVSRHPVNVHSDEFIVLGTEGLWNILGPREVVDFIETYKRPSSSDMSEERTPNLAQLLCEEARLRWEEIAEAEKVPCDDVTCVILELNRDPRPALQRFVATRDAPVAKVKILPVHVKSAPIDLSAVSIPDPRRSACVEGSLTI